MPKSATPRQVLERLLDGISNRHWQELHSLYAEQAVIEYPFALPTQRRLEGRNAIQSYFGAMAGQPLKLRPRNIVVHETGDPEVIVVEWDYDGIVTTTGRSFHVSNIQVSRVRDGLIMASRDYHNHVAVAQAVGRLSDLISALAAAGRDGDATDP
jgi:ketosteroid isomerase-like protein